MSFNNRIQLSFCWAFKGTTPEEGLARLKSCGFEGVELWPDYLEEWGAERWATALEAQEMACFQLCPYFNFVHGEAKIEASRKLLHQYLAAARILNCKRLRVFTGPPWGEGVIGAGEATAPQWQAAIECLQEFCEVAAAQHVELCLECHEGSLMENSGSALRLLHGVHRPNLTTNLQLPLLDEAWQQSLEALAPYTTHIHIHNWEGPIGEGPITYLGEGTFDWEPVVRHLLQAGKSVCLSVEHVDHGGRHDPWEVASRDGAYLNDLRQRVLAG